MKVETWKCGLTLPWFFWKNDCYLQGGYVLVNIKLLYMNNHSNGNISSYNKNTNREKQHSVANHNVDWTVRGAFWEAFIRDVEFEMEG